MREWQAHLAIHYNTTVSVDKLRDTLEEGTAGEGEGGGRRGNALSMATETGSNCLGSASVRLSLLDLDSGHERDGPMRELGLEKGKKKRAGGRIRTRKEVQDILMGTEGIQHLKDCIGSYIYIQQHGVPPPAGNARRSAALPLPHRNQIWYHKVVAVAAGASTLEYADSKKHYQNPVLVRADPDFYGRPWYSDVEIKGENGETWFAKLLLVFRYQTGTSTRSC
jgi:hypothetical protein